MLAEVEKHRPEIREKTGFSHQDFNDFVGVMKKRIDFMPLEQYRSSLGKAEEIAPHEKDAEFFALALETGCAIWSEEGSFSEKQDEVEVYTTNELYEQILGEG